jgi:hypothetical protein
MGGSAAIIGTEANSKLGQAADSRCNLNARWRWRRDAARAAILKGSAACRVSPTLPWAPGARSRFPCLGFLLPGNKNHARELLIRPSEDFRRL